MIIKRLELENIRSYENGKINFPLGSTLLAGDIGSGKTTILLAIEFALFGLQPGQKGTSLLRNNKNEGSVLLEFEILDKKVIIERKLKRAKSVTQDYSAITIDGDKQEKSITEIKNIVLDLLNYPQEFAKKTNLLYKFTVYTPQEEMKQIILENAETRLNTLRHVFGVDKYKKIKENTDLFTIRLREDIRNKQGIIQDLENKKQNLSEKERLVEALASDLLKAEQAYKESSEIRDKIEKELSEIEEKIEERKKFEQEVEKTKILYSGKREMIISSEKEKENLQKQIEETKKLPFTEEELSKLVNQKTEDSEKKEQINKQYLDLQSQISSLNLRNSENLKLKEQILKIKLCPTCLQNVDNQYKENIINKFNNQNQENNKIIAELTVKKEDLNSQLENLKKEIIFFENRINEMNLLKARIDNLKEKEEKIRELDKNRTTLEKDLEILDKHIMILKESILNLSQYESMYIKKQEEFKSALKKEREADLMLAEIRKEMQLTKILIQEIKKEIEEKENVKKQLIYIEELEDWLSNKFLNIISLTERNVMLKLREEFSKLFNEWFNILVPDIFTVRLDEDFTPVIEQQDYELDYSFLSGGERTAVALAYRLALNQTINSLLSKIRTRDIVILDEPTDGFSEQQLDKMRDVLDQLQVKQLILVSHEQKIESFVENIIKFKKESGLSIIEAGSA